MSRNGNPMPELPWIWAGVTAAGVAFFWALYLGIADLIRAWG